MKWKARAAVASLLGVVMAAGTTIPMQAFAAKKPVTITFASWWSSDQINAAIKAFEKTHPNIIVKWDKRVTWDWNQHLAAVAASKSFPDVTMVFDIPTSATNKWLANLNPELKADKSFNAKNTFGNLDATGNLFGRQYALPLSLYVGGIEINTDLFKAANVPLPKPNWTLNEMEQDAIKLTNYQTRQFGMESVQGLNLNIIPEFNPKLGQLTWDGSKYNFTDPAFAKSIQYINKLVNKDRVSPESYPQNEVDRWYGKNKDPWDLGKIAMRPGFSWDFPGLMKEKFHWAFVPMPRGAGQRVQLITDYIGMSSTTKHPKEAFEFLKWLTYSEQGAMARLSWENPVSDVPMIKSAAVWNKYLSLNYIPAGMKDEINMIPNGFIDLYKWLPGYPTVLNNIVGPYYPKFFAGTAKPQDLQSTFEQKANAAYAQAMKALKAALAKN